ncbi:MAG: metal ABC transporter permease [Simkaniaceae bacterium]|nr:metal ABC transporter permease [Simkaniaceae bacterium]
MNPYFNQSFFSFFSVLIQRIAAFKGPLVSDEIQLIVLSLISLMAAILGSFLVLRKTTMLANSLSHTILLGIAITYLMMSGVDFYQLSLRTLLVASLITALMTTLLTEGLTRFFSLQEDASIGLVFTTLFALGIVIVTLYAKNAHIGTEAIMGNVDALHRRDISPVLAVAGVVLSFVGIFFKPLKVTSFDPILARGLKISVPYYHYLLMILTAIAAIAAFRAVGVFLFLSLLVGPPLIARMFTKNLLSYIFLSVGVGVVASFFAVALSRHFLSIWQMPLSTAGIQVCLITLALVGSSCIYHRCGRYPQTS